MDIQRQFVYIGMLVSLFTLADGCQQYEKCVYQEIFTTRSYNKLIRPVLSPNHTVNVKVQLVVLGLQNIIEIDGTMITVSFFRTSWVDPMLTWDPAMFGGVETIVIPANEIWVPDIALSNSATKFYEITYTRDFHVSIDYNGTVYWPFGGTLSTNCDISLKIYPFDNQSCSIDIESWMYTNAEVDLSFYSSGGLDISRMGKNTLWTLSSTNTQSVLLYNKSFRRLTFTLEFTRKPLYYYVNILIPTLLLMFVALAVFWLPADCGEKISLAITVLLAFSVFQIVIMSNTPVNSDVVPEITQFVLAVMIMATISLLTSMAVTYISGKDPNNRAPLWLRKLCLSYLARLMCMDIAKLQRNEKEKYVKKRKILNGFHNRGMEDTNFTNIRNQENSYNRRRLYASNDSSNVKIYHTGKKNESGLMYVKTLPSKSDPDRIHNNNLPHYDANGSDLKHEESLLVTDIRKILANMTEMKTRMEKKTETNKHQQEWKRIGKVVDRFLFWITFLLLLALMAYIFMVNRV